MHPFFLRLLSWMAIILALSPLATAGPVRHDVLDVSRYDTISMNSKRATATGGMYPRFVRCCCS